MQTLALSRRPGESVVIGDPKDPIGYVRLVSARPGRAKLCFQFPEAVKLNRLEVLEKQQKEVAAS